MSDYEHPYRTFRGTSASHRCRLRLPDAARPLPVVVNLHGGFWKPEWNLQTLPTETLLSGFGDDVATWDVEYARVDQTSPAASPAWR